MFILDDDEFSHEVIAGSLNQLGVSTIYTSHSGADALRQLAALKVTPDMLICDILMPDMDGMDFLLELKKLNYSGKVMLVSGIAKDVLLIAENVVKTDGINIIGAFVKPIKLEELRKAIF
jgi:two-component system response regulator YesN